MTLANLLHGAGETGLHFTPIVSFASVAGAIVQTGCFDRPFRHMVRYIG